MAHQFRQRLYWLVGAYCLIMVQCTPNSHQDVVLTPTPSWQEITIGQTTAEEVIEILGEPDSIGGEGSRTIWYEYTDISPNRPDTILIDTKCNCVTSIHADMLVRNRESPITLQGAFDEYGPPEAVTQAPYPGGTAAFIYAAQGFVIVAQESRPADEAVVWAVFYYQAMPLKLFMKSWAADWPREVPYWKQYEYKP